MDLEYARDLISQNYYKVDQVVYDWVTYWYERARNFVRLKESDRKF
ncbi:hypothetical protein [Flammeovirga pectinis]|nr:hypothetical protein [Flammeovirga pectinis]